MCICVCKRVWKAKCDNSAKSHAHSPRGCGVIESTCECMFSYVKLKYVSMCQLHSTQEKVIEDQAFTADVGFGKMTKKDKGLSAVVGNFFNP